jgi:3-phenylpropionate/trans-cinnamate dioxygenase ferredoxin component
MAEFTRAAALSDVPPNTLLGVDVDGVSVCLANADGHIYAFRNNCSHQDYPLDTGELVGTDVTCSWHGAHFDIVTGKATRLPAIKPIRTYEVRVEGDDILVAVA